MPKHGPTDLIWSDASALSPRLRRQGPTYWITRRTHVPIWASRQRPDPGSPETSRRQCCTGCGWALWTRQLDCES